MYTLTKALLLALLLGAPLSVSAALKIFACEPEWAALAQELGGDKISVFAATTAFQDPHHVEARPSLIAKLRQADLLVCTGAELELGWLPMLLRQAGNDKVQPNQPGYFEAATMVTLLEIPERVDRSMGDVHASGNPHINTDPRRIGQIGKSLSDRLALIDAANRDYYRARQHDFNRRWEQALARWTARGAPLKGVRVVAHHKDWSYLNDWLGLLPAGYLEPKPGVPPSAAHLTQLKSELGRNPARLIMRTPYEDARPGDWLSGQTRTPVVVLPYTVGGTPEAKDLFSLFDVTIERLLKFSS